MLQSIRTAVFDTLVGTDWEGVRVRAATHRMILPGEEDISGQSAEFRYVSSLLKHGREIAEESLIEGRNGLCAVSREGFWLELLLFTACHLMYSFPPFLPPTFCRCVGTITQYCAASDEHLVVFDETFLQPKWVTVSADSLDVILGQDETDITRTYNTALYCTA